MKLSDLSNSELQYMIQTLNNDIRDILLQQNKSIDECYFLIKPLKRSIKRIEGELESRRHFPKSARS